MFKYIFNKEFEVAQKLVSPESLEELTKQLAKASEEIDETSATLQNSYQSLDGSQVENSLGAPGSSNSLDLHHPSLPKESQFDAFKIADKKNEALPAVLAQEVHQNSKESPQAIGNFYQLPIDPMTLNVNFQDFKSSKNMMNLMSPPGSFIIPSHDDNKSTSTEYEIIAGSVLPSGSETSEEVLNAINGDEINFAAFLKPHLEPLTQIPTDQFYTAFDPSSSSSNSNQQFTHIIADTYSSKQAMKTSNHNIQNISTNPVNSSNQILNFSNSPNDPMSTAVLLSPPKSLILNPSAIETKSAQPHQTFEPSSIAAAYSVQTSLAETREVNSTFQVPYAPIRFSKFVETESRQFIQGAKNSIKNEKTENSERSIYIQNPIQVTTFTPTHPLSPIQTSSYRNSQTSHFIQGTQQIGPNLDQQGSQLAFGYNVTPTKPIQISEQIFQDRPSISYTREPAQLDKSTSRVRTSSVQHTQYENQQLTFFGGFNNVIMEKKRSVSSFRTEVANRTEVPFLPSLNLVSTPLKQVDMNTALAGVRVVNRTATPRDHQPVFVRPTTPVKVSKVHHFMSYEDYLNSKPQ